MESSAESDSPPWNNGAHSSERGATGAPSRSCSACGTFKRHKVSTIVTLVASIVFYLLGAGPAGRAALKLKFRGVRWGSQNKEDVTLMKIFFSEIVPLARTANTSSAGGAPPPSNTHRGASAIGDGTPARTVLRAPPPLRPPTTC